MSPKHDGMFHRVYEIVVKIPPGRVMTYGQIAEILDRQISPAAVGWALSQCPADLPWQRVVNGRGGCSLGERQLERLRQEGIEFTQGRLDLEVYRYHQGSP